MYCPHCGRECAAETMVCPACATRLDGRKEDGFIPLLSTFNPGDIALIKSILDSEGLRYFFQGENFNLVRPLACPAVLMVRADQVETARELLQDLKLSYWGVSGGE